MQCTVHVSLASRRGIPRVLRLLARLCTCSLYSARTTVRHMCTRARLQSCRRHVLAPFPGLGTRLVRSYRSSGPRGLAGFEERETWEWKMRKCGNEEVKNSLRTAMPARVEFLTSFNIIFFPLVGCLYTDYQFHILPCRARRGSGLGWGLIQSVGRTIGQRLRLVL